MLEELLNEMGNEPDLGEVGWCDLLYEPREERPVVQERLREEAPDERAAMEGESRST